MAGQLPMTIYETEPNFSSIITYKNTFKNLQFFYFNSFLRATEKTEKLSCLYQQKPW